MTTAERILSEFPFESFAQQERLETELLELKTKIDYSNCYDRVWHFYDGSTVTKTRDGFVAGRSQQ